MILPGVSGGRRRRLIVLSAAVTVAAALALTLTAMTSLNEVVAAAVPSMVRTNLEQRAKAVEPDLVGVPPERSRAGRWLQEQSGGISSLQLSKSPHVAITVSSSVGVMAIVDRRGLVVAARGLRLAAGSPLRRYLPAGAGASLRAALAGRRDAAGLTTRLPDGSVAGAAAILGASGRVIGALLATFTGLDQPHLLGGALLTTLGVSAIVGPPAALTGALLGLLLGRGTRPVPAPAPAAAAGGAALGATDGGAPGLARFECLTTRELEVLRLMAEAHTNSVIAARLHISESTVKKHVSNILGKLEVPDRTQAAVLAWEHGLVRRDT